MKPRQSRTSHKRRVIPPREAANPAPPQLVQIEKPIYGGAFLTHIDGKATFVPFTLPGEQVRIHITNEKQGYATAEVDEIITTASERVAPVCRHFGACGGCHYQHASYETQLAIKKDVLRETLQRGGVQIPEEIMVLAAATEAQSWGFRNRIRLTFDADGNPGYRGRRSHEVVPIDECPIAAPLLIKAAKIIADIGKELSFSLRQTEISLFCDASESALLLSIFSSSLKKDMFDHFARGAAERIPELRGVGLLSENRLDERSPAQFQRTVAQQGDHWLTYRAAGFDYRVDHGAFFQVNRWLVDGLVEQVTTGQNGKLAWDLFAGVGLFARSLTNNFARVVAVESAPSAIEALKENLRGTSGSGLKASTLDFLRANLRSERPDLIVVDPPRMGLGTEIATHLVEVAAERVVYVSCDPATLARDLRLLIASGYSIESLALADLFPHTFHLETVVHLHRS